MAGEKQPDSNQVPPEISEPTTEAPGSYRPINYAREMAYITLVGRGNSIGNPYMSNDEAIETLFGTPNSPAESEDK